MKRKKTLLLIINILVLTGLIKVIVGATDIEESNMAVLPSASATVTTPIATPIINPYETPEHNPGEPNGSKGFRLETKRISVRVAKNKRIRIALVVYGTWVRSSRKTILRYVNKGYFKFKSNKPKIAKVTKKGVVKGIKKGNAIIKVTLQGADEPQYCKVKVLPKKKHKN